MTRDELMHYAPLPEKVHQRMMQTAYQLEEEMIVKKKISLALVLALTLALIAAAAVAAGLLWENYAPQIKQTEMEQGAYPGWKTEDKIKLVQALVDAGALAASEDTERLFDPDIPDAEANALADQLVTAFTGMEVSEISLPILTYAVMGYEATWSPEQWVWWLDVVGYESGAVDKFVIPGEGDLPVEEAIRIANERLTEVWGLEDDYLEKNTQSYAILYITTQRPDYRRWIVHFEKYREGTERYVERKYSAVVDNTGTVIADPDIEEPLPEDRAADAAARAAATPSPLGQAMQTFNAQVDNAPFSQWPLELKAEYSQVINPMVQGAIQSGDYAAIGRSEESLSPELRARTSFVYGLPGAEDMAEADALNLAKETLMQTHGLDSEALAQYDDIHVYFDITNPEVPLWKFVFTSDKITVSTEEGQYTTERLLLWYKVEIASRTGEVIKAEPFEFTYAGRTLEQELMRY
ncbi:MAG: hypothetical protein LBN04_04640 [Oscillospiraceae bacterium]|jgi:hypothetical protein|nr:hypothetical protein [Oscillospiraceae bacterium]